MQPAPSAPMKIEPVLNEDGTLSLPACTLDTEHVDELLRSIAVARSRMRPEVPAHMDITTAVVVDQPDPTFAVGKHSDGGVTLGLRHQGYGWLVYDLPPKHAAALAAFIAKRVAADEDIGLVGEEQTGGGGAKH
jgi:hypothetical protein